nr:flagellar hook protein FlgE [Burkholderiaceae bacterium]
MSFQSGLSGLNAAARNLDVIGHNVANSNTVGAKASRAEFADVYANSLNGGGGSFAGIGVMVSDVGQQFTQGDIATSSNPLDMAINGSGFFRLNNGGVMSYSRNGQFQLDKDGYIVNAQGARLTGYLADDSGNINVGVPQDLRLNSRDTSPKATTEATVSMNLDARSTPPVGAFDLDDATTYQGATSMSVYDQQGQAHTLSLYFRNTGVNTWDVYAASDGTQLGTGPVSQLTFQPDGRLDSTATTVPVALSVPVAGGAGGTLNVDLDMGKATQFGSIYGVSELTQDGFTTGRLVGFTMSADGVLQARYTNGQTLAQGQVALATFANPQGLSPLGGNAWAETATSGQPLVGSPGSGSLGVLQSGATESSNVDLTAELVNMISAQRAYQANAQTIK